MQATGKMNPGRDDKVEFMMALDSCLTGPLSLKMLYFYRHLLQYGPPNGIPTLHQNIFFYVEVQKFKVSSQAPRYRKCKRVHLLTSATFK